MAEKEVKKEVKELTSAQKFKNRKLQALNNMQNKAKARALAERVLQNN